MKVVILAGGFGTRISEESTIRPKPMVEIGGKPILWHIMKLYLAQGYNEFIICCGYMANYIKQYFANYYLHNCNITFDFTNGNDMQIHSNTTEPWKVTLIDTGLNTMTGGRMKRIAPYVGDETFMMTYGDGVSDVDLRSLLAHHQAHGKYATITTVNPGQRFGIIDMDKDGRIKAFREKSNTDGSLINGGFFALEPKIFDYIPGDDTVFELGPLEALAAAGQLMAYRHGGFWKCMDTLSDKNQLEALWANGEAPWKKW